MAGDHHQHVVTDEGSDQDARLVAARAAWDAALSDDADPLAALRRVWLASDDGAATEAIRAATEPLSPAQQEQIVQRLLRDNERARPQRRRAAWAPRLRSPALRRVPLWSVAAAGTLCCWMATQAPPAMDIRGTESAAARRPASAAADAEARLVATGALHDAHGAVFVPRRATSPDLTELAESYVQQQRFDEAEALFQRALTERERLLGPAHKDVADTLTRLAALYQTQHLYAKAEPLYVRALEIDPPFAVF